VFDSPDEDAPKRCEAEYSGYLFPDGRFVPSRCGKRTCARCRWLRVEENMAVVKLDAEMRMPTVGVTLTTVDPMTTLSEYRVARAQWTRWLRSECGPQVGLLGFIEHTTGKARGSDGQRRMHEHILVKRIPADVALSEIEAASSKIWERLTGAHRVEVKELATPLGAITYLVAHNEKKAQAPPPGWTGKSLRPSKNYYECSIIYLM
jgi:hypothetical protein